MQMKKQGSECSCIISLLKNIFRKHAKVHQNLHLFERWQCIFAKAESIHFIKELIFKTLLFQTVCPGKEEQILSKTMS